MSYAISIAFQKFYSLIAEENENGPVFFNTRPSNIILMKLKFSDPYKLEFVSFTSVSSFHFL